MWSFRGFVLQPSFMKTGLEPALSNVHYSLYILDILLVTLFGYWINDWYDRSIDAINKPNRFLVTIRISQRQFVSFITVQILLIFLLSYFIAQKTGNMNKLWILPSVLLSLWIYAKWLKRKKLVGNVLVSLLIGLLVGMVFLSEIDNIVQLRSLSLATFNQLLYWSLTYVILIVVANYIRELIKDLEDESGDRLHHVSSVPSKIGTKPTHVLIQALLLILMCFEITQVLFIQKTYSSILFVFALCTLCAVLAFKLKNPLKNPEYSSLSKWVKWLMLIGVLQMFIIEF